MVLVFLGGEVVFSGETIDLTKFEKKKERVASSSQILKKEGKKKRKRIFKDQESFFSHLINIS